MEEKMGKSICEVNLEYLVWSNRKKVFDHLNNLGCKNIFICDPYIRDKKASINFMEKDELLKSSDIVSLIFLKRWDPKFYWKKRN